MNSIEQTLLEAMLPEGILEYFEIVDLKTESRDNKIYSKTMTIYLEEKNMIPEEYKNHIYKACGFMEERTIDDYPIRDKLVKISIKRRRWEVTIDNKKKKISRDWSIIAKGTRMSDEYSAFLKEISRF